MPARCQIPLLSGHQPCLAATRPDEVDVPGRPEVFDRVRPAGHRERHRNSLGRRLRRWLFTKDGSCCCNGNGILRCGGSGIMRSIGSHSHGKRTRRHASYCAQSYVLVQAGSSRGGRARQLHRWTNRPSHGTTALRWVVNHPHRLGRCFFRLPGLSALYFSQDPQQTAPICSELPSALSTLSCPRAGWITPFQYQHAEPPSPQAVLYMSSLPLSANVLHMTVMATNAPLVGRG